jgi:hypothetical protein
MVAEAYSGRLAPEPTYQFHKLGDMGGKASTLVFAVGIYNADDLSV